MLVTKEKYNSCPGYTMRLGMGGKKYRYFIIENGHVEALEFDFGRDCDELHPKDLWLTNEDTRKELSKYHDPIHTGCYYNVPYDLFVKWTQQHKEHGKGFYSTTKNDGCHRVLHGNCENCNQCANFKTST